MSLNLILTIVASLAIGFWAGLSYAKQKYEQRISRLQRQITDLRNPPTDEVPPSVR